MNKRSHGGNIEDKIKSYSLNKEEVIDFSANINFLGPPVSVIEGIKEGIGGIINYPTPNSPRLKEALAKEFDLEKNNLIIGNGAVELIYLIAKVLKPAKALVLAPTFSEYSLAIESVGGVVEEFSLKRELEFRVDVEGLLNSLKEIDILFLCNPNNPTGRYLKRREVLQILDEAKRSNTFLVVDEAFIDFLEDEEGVVDLVREYDNLFVLRSLTKFFAIPGLRLGYGASNKDLINRMEKAKDPWNVNSLAQRAGVLALQDKDYIEKTKVEIKREKEFLYNKLKGIKGLKVYYPYVNYILIDLKETGLTATSLEERLGREGILIRNCSNYSGLGEDFIRIAVKGREDNLKLIDKVRGFFW